MWHAGTFTDAVRAMTAGTGGFCDAPAFRNIFRVCIQGSQLRTVVGIDPRLSGRAFEISSSEKHTGNCPQGDQGRAAKASAQTSEKNPDARNAPISYTHLRAHETRHDLVC